MMEHRRDLSVSMDRANRIVLFMSIPVARLDEESAGYGAVCWRSSCVPFRTMDDEPALYLTKEWK